MLSWAITFLLLAIVAGTVGVMAVGPVGLILFFVFIALFGWYLLQHFRERGRSLRK